jgi:hypothetical protein
VTLIIPISGLVSAQQSITPNTIKKTLFPPFAYLQYGPNPTDGVPVYFRSAELLSGNQTMTVYFPSTIMSDRDTAIPIYINDTLQATFDSYFLFNRLLPQFIPKVSNVSISIAKVLNPFEATRTTQLKLGPPMNLPVSNESSIFSRSFVIAGPVKTGFNYLTLSVYFPNYKIHAIYSNTANIHTYDRSLALALNATSSISNQTSSYPNNTSSSYPNNTSSSYPNNTSSSYLSKPNAFLYNYSDSSYQLR